MPKTEINFFVTTKYFLPTITNLFFEVIVNLETLLGNKIFTWKINSIQNISFACFWSSNDLKQFLFIKIARIDTKKLHFLKIHFGEICDSLMSTVMFVTSLRWWFCDGDRFVMLVAESLCWRLFSLCWWFSQYMKLVTNILKRSPTSQHIWSPRSVTNIHVTLFDSIVLETEKNCSDSFWFVKIFGI